jgi:hypothetical protein
MIVEQPQELTALRRFASICQVDAFDENTEVISYRCGDEVGAHGRSLVVDSGQFLDRIYCPCAARSRTASVGRAPLGEWEYESAQTICQQRECFWGEGDSRALRTTPHLDPCGVMSPRHHHWLALANEGWVHVRPMTRR